MDLFDTPQARRKNACRMGPPTYTADASIIDGPSTPNPVRLPNEIWIIICRHADFASSKQLRLVNKASSELAAKKLYTDVYVTALPDSFLKLRNIAHHPFLSTFVNQMVYIIDRLDTNIARMKDWSPIAAHVSTYKLSPDTLSKNRMLRQLCLEQRAFVQSGEEVDFLKECVELLPNLGDISATSATALAAELSNGPQPILGPLFRETLIDVYSLFTGSILDRKFARPHVALIKAFHHSNRSMRVLDMDDVPWGFWEDMERTALFRQIKPCINVAFANLKAMTISTWLGDMGRAVLDRNSPISRFVDFLSAAPQLECLQLWIQPVNHQLEMWDVEDTDLTDVFELLTWPQLRTFRINNCRVERDAFIGFMERHAGSLRHMRLCMIELAEPLSVPGATQPRSDATFEDDGPSAPGASWAFAIKHLAPLMDLCCADLRLLEDRFLERKSGGTVMISMLDEDMDPDQWDNRSRWCEELGAYFVTKGRDWLCPFPIYGTPFYPKCPLCNKIIDGNESHFDENGDIEGWGDEPDAETDDDNEDGSGDDGNAEKVAGGEDEALEEAVVLRAKNLEELD